MKTLILNSLNRLHKDEAGQGLVEYALILTLVVVVVVVVLIAMGGQVKSLLSNVSTALGV